MVARTTLLNQSERTLILHEARAVINEKIEEPKQRSFFSFLASFFHKDSQEAERQKKLGNIVRSMAAYLALSHSAGATVDKISNVGRMLAKTQVLSSEEDRALLERTRLAALLRKEPGRLQEIKENLHIYFKNRKNHDFFAKWKKEGFSEEAFLLNPTIPSFIFENRLHAKAKLYDMPFQYDAQSHQFMMKVNGVYRNVAEAVEKFSMQKTPLLGSFRYHLVSKGGKNEKWDFLPQKGLIKWNEDEWTRLNPIANITPAQVKFAQESARTSDGKAGKTGDYVVEIVLTKENFRSKPLISGFQETFKRFPHPWVRIITPEGKLYSFGFNMEQNVKVIQPTASVKGAFRNPDTCETRPFSQRLVSGFVVSKRVCDKLINEVERYQKGGTRFNFLEKNCTAFVQRVKEIIDPKMEATFSADVPELFRRSLPISLQKMGEKLSPAWRFITYYSSQFAPPFVIKIAKVVSSLFRLIAERLALTFSGRWFSYGKKDSFPTDENPHKGIPWYKFATHINIALKRKLVRVFLPVKVGEWLESLPQTRIVKDNTPILEQYGTAKA